MIDVWIENDLAEKGLNIIQENSDTSTHVCWLYLVYKPDLEKSHQLLF